MIDAYSLSPSTVYPFSLKISARKSPAVFTPDPAGPENQILTFIFVLLFNHINSPSIQKTLWFAKRTKIRVLFLLDEMRNRGITLLLKKMPKWVHTIRKLLSENNYKKYEETI